MQEHLDAAMQELMYSTVAIGPAHLGLRLCADHGGGRDLLPRFRQHSRRRER